MGTRRLIIGLSASAALHASMYFGIAHITHSKSPSQTTQQILSVKLVTQRTQPQQPRPPAKPIKGKSITSNQTPSHQSHSGTSQPTENQAPINELAKDQPQNPISAQQPQPKKSKRSLFPQIIDVIKNTPYDHAKAVDALTPKDENYSHIFDPRLRQQLRDAAKRKPVKTNNQHRTRQTSVNQTVVERDGKCSTGTRADDGSTQWSIAQDCAHIKSESQKMADNLKRALKQRFNN